MPQGSPFEFEPQETKGDPSKGRATYGGDVDQTIPFIDDDRKPTVDPFLIKPPETATRPDAERATPQGLFPEQTFTEAHKDKLGPGGIMDQREKTALEKQYAEINEILQNRDRVKGNDPWIYSVGTAAGTALTVGSIQNGILDPRLKAAADKATFSSVRTEGFADWYNRSHNHLTAEGAGSWFNKNYDGRSAISRADRNIDDALGRIHKIVSEGGDEIAHADLTKLTRAADRLNGAAVNSYDDILKATASDGALSHNGLRTFQGKQWKSSSGIVFDGDEVARLVEDKRTAVGGLYNESQKFTVADDVAQGWRSVKSRAAIAGLAAASMSIGDDYFRGSVFNNLSPVAAPITDVEHKTGVSGLAIPLALSTHKIGDSKWKTGGKLLGAMTVSAGVDALMKDSALTAALPEPIKRTTWEDGLAMGGALYFMPRAKNWKGKAAIFASAYVAGNLLDGALSSTAREDIDVPTTAAIKTMEQVGKERNFNNMKLAVHSWNKVGERSIGAEGAVWTRFQELNNYTPSSSGRFPERTERWNSLSGPEKFENRMDLAIMARSLGELRLEGGKRIPQDNDEAFYVLKDNKIDLGGYALEKLLTSKVETGEAIKLALDDSVNGHMLNGTTINAAREVPQLQQFQQDTSKKINEIIETPHDMETLVKDLMHLRRQELGIDTFSKQVLQDTQNRVGQFQHMAFQTEEGRTLVAKLLRDEAVIRLAIAKQHLESGNGLEASKMLAGTDQGEREYFPDLRKGPNGQPQQKGYDGVRGALELSMMLDPDNPDVIKLVDMYNKTLQETPEAIRSQMRNRNILNVDNGRNR